jgi:DNA-binding IclR family transcriptional regulator
VLNQVGEAVAAVSIPFLSTHDESRIGKLTAAAIATAKEISKVLGA